MEPQTQALPLTDAESVSRSALELLAATGQRGSQLQLRNGFVSRLSAHYATPLATELLRSSHKSGLQLRLALTYFWLAGSRVGGNAGSRPYTVALPVRALTQLMGGDSEVAGDRRRIRDNTKALAKAGLVELHDLRHSLEITLKRDTPVNPEVPARQYYRPGAPSPSRDQARDGYVTVPSSFFTDGWISALTPSGVVVLLAFRYLQQTKPTTEQGLFISEGLRRERFGFSEGTYYAGSVELEKRGLAKSWSQHLRSPVADGATKVRRVYALRPGLFDGYAMTESHGTWPNPAAPVTAW